MSNNLELVRSIYAAWGRGDFYSSAEWADPEIEFVVVDGPEPFRSKGAGSMAERWRSWLGAWENYGVALDELRELDAERVLALVHYVGRGKTSGLELEHMQTAAANVLHIHEEKVTKFVAYNDRNRALADLGLAPEKRPPGS